MVARKPARLVEPFLRAAGRGRNDYVVKPFRLSILLARLRAQLRQHEQSEDAVFMIGPYIFRPSAKVMIHGETKKKVRLTETETSILKYLYRSGSNVVGPISTNLGHMV